MIWKPNIQLCSDPKKISIIGRDRLQAYKHFNSHGHRLCVMQQNGAGHPNCNGKFKGGVGISVEKVDEEKKEELGHQNASSYNRTLSDFCFVHTLDPITPVKKAHLAKCYEECQGKLPPRANLKALAQQLSLSQNAIRRWWIQHQHPPALSSKQFQEHLNDATASKIGHSNRFSEQGIETKANIQKEQRQHQHGFCLEIEQLALQIQKNWSRIHQLQYDVEDFVRNNSL